uniref:Homeobox domain-containing protein n=1 Tax=Strigamia maritima TaxID=126957 RepID=T1IP47_STRMM
MTSLNLPIRSTLKTHSTITYLRMMRDDKQLCLQQLPPKSYIERHKIHENDQNKTPNYIETSHQIANPMDTTRMTNREHPNCPNWDSWTPTNTYTNNTNPHFNNMLLYYESRSHSLTVPSPRHQQLTATIQHHHHHPCGQMQFLMPQMPLEDPEMPLQTPWHAPSTHNSMPASTSYSQTPIFDEWDPRNACAHPASGSAGQYSVAAALPPYKNDQTQEISQPPSGQDSNFSHIGQLSPESVSPVSSAGVSGSESPGVSQPSHDSSSSVVSQMHGLIRPSAEQNEFDWIKKPSYQMECHHTGKTRTKDKYRVVYSDLQRLELEKEFYVSRYITMKRKAELAQLFGLSERQVKIWFQNRRAKERKQVKKQEELVRKEKDFAVHHHFQQMQMACVDGSWQSN